MLIILILAELLLIWFIIENMLILSVRCEKIGSRGIKIVHLSDLHKRSFGEKNERLIKLVDAQKPDLIIFSGDAVTRDCRNFDGIKDLFVSLTGVAPTFFANGNHELDLPDEYRSELDKILISCGVHYMRNGNEKITVKEHTFTIAFDGLKRTVYKKNDSYRNLDTYTADELREKTGSINGGELILIAHNPFFAEEYAKIGAEFTFCGHVHGGIVRIFNKGLLSPERKFFPKYSKGVYTIGKMKLLVSGGLGKIRLFNMPEIVVYEI